MKKGRKVVIGIFLLVCPEILSGCKQAQRGQQVKEPITLSVLAGQTTADAGMEDMINDCIKESYPNVVLEWNTVEWGSEFEDLLRADMASGEIPDIIIGKAQDVQAYYKTGNLAELDSSFAPYFSYDTLDDVVVDGNLYGIPYNMDYQGVIYNRDIFEKLHLQVPKTREQLQQVVAALEANNITPFVWCGQDNTLLTTNTMQFMLNDIFLTDKSWGKKFRMGQVFMDQSDEVNACFENVGYMCAHSFTDALQLEPYECNVRFATGQAAMYMTSTWALSSILPNSSTTNYGIFPYPNMTGDAKLIRETNLTFMKGADTAYGELIDEIFKTIVTNESLCSEISDFTQTIPVVKGMKSSCLQEMQTEIDSYEQNNQVIDSIDGYSQLSWNYMDEITQKQLEWIKGNCSLKELIDYANLKRQDSDKLK